jgi:membrane fusion protein (multidrug efflux system)
MSAELEGEKLKREAAERAAREAIATAASEHAARQDAEKLAQDALATVSAERAAREGAVQSANKAKTDLAAEQAKREEAVKMAREADATAASERAARQSVEQALHAATVRSASDRTEREAAVKAARDAASEAATERASRAEAERIAQEASAQAAGERRAREAAEAVAREARAKAATVPTPQAPIKASDPTAPHPPTTTEPAKNASTTNWAIPIFIFAAAGILFFLISGLWTTWESTTSVKTDDAYIRADVAPLSTKVTGVVRQTTVNDYDKVKAGQILVELKNDEYKARVEQGRQAIRDAEIKLSDMKQKKEQQDARVAEAQSALESSRTSIKEADDSIASAQAAIDEARAGIEAAKAAIHQSEASTRAASAGVTRTAAERARQEALLAAESSTKERLEKIVEENDQAVANLEAQKATQTKAQAELSARQAQLSKAMQQLSTSRSEKEKSLLAVQSRQSELTAQRKQRELLDGEQKQLVADLASKNAGLTSTQVDLDYTIVRAPIDGVVGELKVKPGQFVSAGTQVITVISATPWVIANYRETQLSHVKDGDLVEVQVDALPGTHLKGHVERIAPASGAQFSLLPPDNASGNFTKITQRIPVKICFDESGEKLAGLRPGMSATATIKPGSNR